MIQYTATLAIWKDLANWIGTHGVKIVAILIGAYILHRVASLIVTSVMRRAVKFEQTFTSDLDRQKRLQTFTSLINAVIGVMIWIVAGILVLQEFGVQPAPLMTGAGVLGVGLAFGTQALVKDFVSGLFIVMENQYRVGDEVELDTTKGTVEHLGIRTTVLRDEDGNIHFVPNGIIQRTTNRSMGFSKIKLSLTVAAKTDREQLHEIVDKLGEKIGHTKKWLPHFIEKLHFSEIGEVTDKKLEVIIAGKVKTAYKSDISTEFRTKLLDTLARKEIKVMKLTEVKEAEPKDEKKK